MTHSSVMVVERVAFCSSCLTRGKQERSSEYIPSLLHCDAVKFLVAVILGRHAIIEFNACQRIEGGKGGTGGDGER